MGLKLVLSNASGVPIYEQIEQQIKAAILAGDCLLYTSDAADD